MSKIKKQLPKNILKTDYKNIRNFVYSIEDTSLGFSLSLDNDQQAKRFLAMLVQAQIDVQKMIDEELT